MADKKKCQNLTEDGIRIFPEADWTQARGHRSTLYPACTHQSEERLVLAHGLLRLREVSQVTIGFTPFLPSPACRWISSSTKRSLDRHLSCRGEELRWGNLSQSVIFFFFSFTKMWPMLHRKGHKRQRSSWGKVKSESEVAQSCLTLCDPMYHSLPGFSIHGIFPAKSNGVGCHFPLQGSSQLRDQT